MFIRFYIMGDKTKVVPSTVIKNPRGKYIETGQKVMIYNFYQNLYKTGDCEYSKTKCVHMTASALGVGKASVWRTITEMERQGFVKSPNKKRRRSTKYDTLDEEGKKRIFHIINSFFKNNAIPTVDQIYQAVRDDTSLPTIGRSTVWQILNKLGFGRKKPAVHVRSDSDEVLEANPKGTKVVHPKTTYKLLVANINTKKTKVVHLNIPSDSKKRPPAFRVIKLPSTSRKSEEIEVVPNIVSKIEPRSPSLARDSVELEENDPIPDPDIAEINKFENIWKGSVKLPSEFWSMSKVSQTSKYVLFSKYVMLDEGPIEEKQLVIKQNLQLECYVYRKRYEHSELFPVRVGSVQHVEAVLRTLDSRGVCPGLLPHHQDTRLDVSRHTRCPVLLNHDQPTCEHCTHTHNPVQS